MSVNSVFKITLLYLAFGLLWIFLSDSLLSVFVPGDILQQAKIQTLKGCGYVVLTASLLYVLIKRYHQQLQDKITALEKTQSDLGKSEDNYRKLFDSSPMPIFIYDPQTEHILKVNNAALSYYGYTAQEFNHMSILQIEDEEETDVRGLEEKLQITKHEGMTHTQGIHRHKMKDGSHAFVYMQGSVIEFRGTKAHIVMITDITNQLQYIDRVEEQNIKLNKIAYMQSHVVRAPLATLMGLVHLLKDETQDHKDIVDKVLTSADELDSVIKNISKETGSNDLP